MVSLRKHNPKKKLTLNYVLALLFIGLQTVGSYYVFLVALDIREHDARIINIAGQQGMLSQKIVKLALLIEKAHDARDDKLSFGELENNLREFWRLHEGLKKGDDILKLPGNNSTEIDEMIKSLEPYFQKIRRAGEDILHTASYTFEERDIVLKRKMALLLENEVYFQELMSQVTYQYELEARNNQAFLKNAILFVMLLNLLVLVSVGIWVFKPAVNKISLLFTKVAQEREELSQINAELASAQEEAMNSSEALLEANLTLVNTKKKVEQALQSENELRHRAEDANQQLVKVHADLEYKNKQVEASINYAQRIQDSLLPQIHELNSVIEDAFIYFRPKDVVSGDFYWYLQKDYKTIITAVDCMGHGVPGAFMSLIGERLLYETVYIKGITSAAGILNELDKKFKTTFKSEFTENGDTLDIALCVIDNHPQKLELFNQKPRVEFAGARNPLVYFKGEETIEIKGDRMSVGGKKRKGEEFSFTNHVIELDEPGYFYIFSDGYQDQFGGPEERGKKFTKKRLVQLLKEIHLSPFEEQQSILNSELEKWMHNDGKRQIQIDDVLVIGFRIN